jgi:hypothetical protein
VPCESTGGGKEDVESGKEGERRGLTTEAVARGVSRRIRTSRRSNRCNVSGSLARRHVSGGVCLQGCVSSRQKLPSDSLASKSVKRLVATNRQRPLVYDRHRTHLGRTWVWVLHSLPMVQAEPPTAKYRHVAAGPTALAPQYQTNGLQSSIWPNRRASHLGYTGEGSFGRLSHCTWVWDGRSFQHGMARSKSNFQGLPRTARTKSGRRCAHHHWDALHGQQAGATRFFGRVGSGFQGF